MLTAQQFQTSQPFRLLLIGPPLSGKTNVAMNFENPYFLDADDKLANAVARHKGKKFFYDCPLRRPDVTNTTMVPVDPSQRWTYGTDCLKAAAGHTDIKTIIIDSASAMSDMLIEHILQFPSTSKNPLTVGGIKVMDQSMWLPFRDLWKRLIMGIGAIGKPLIVICHEDWDKDEVSGNFLFRPLIPGSLKSNFASMFTDVWRTETKNVADPSRPGQSMTKYFVRTQPLGTMQLGNSLGLPAEFEFTFEEFQKHLTEARRTLEENIKPV